MDKTVEANVYIKDVIHFKFVTGPIVYQKLLVDKIMNIKLGSYLSC